MPLRRVIETAPKGAITLRTPSSPLADLACEQLQSTLKIQYELQIPREISNYSKIQTQMTSQICPLICAKALIPTLSSAQPARG